MLSKWAIKAHTYFANHSNSFTDDTGRMVIIEPAKIPTIRDQLHTEQIATASEKATILL